jgi:hypothetical protein
MRKEFLHADSHTGLKFCTLICHYMRHSVNPGLSISSYFFVAIKRFPAPFSLNPPFFCPFNRKTEIGRSINKAINHDQEQYE